MEALAGKVEEASKVLSEYNSRLEAELKERREIQELLDAFTWQQKELLRGAKKRLKVSTTIRVSFPGSENDSNLGRGPGDKDNPFLKC